MEPQGELDFNAPSPEADGVAHWHQQRRRAVSRLASRLGLPLDRPVEVWLKDGVVLRGKLELKESVLFLEAVDEQSLELVVGRVNFRYLELESCVRTD